MKRIEKLFKRLKKERKKAFIAYITGGDPSLSLTEKLIYTLEESGVDLIEIGIPFSDPLADGPTIQRASQRALSKGVRVRSILKTVARARRRTDIPIVFMTYYNLIQRFGIKSFVSDAKKKGADGIIIPDLPPEEADELVSASRKKNFATIFLAAPTSTRERLKKIAKYSRGFIYYVSLTGVTGARKKLPRDIVDHVKKLKKISKTPVCVGFGISNANQAWRISRLADGIIVGSALINIIEKNAGKKDMQKKVASFLKNISNAVHRS